MEHLKVYGKEHLLREKSTGAIINSDSNEYNNYLKMREIKSREQMRIENLENQVSSVKNDLNEIKNLLQELVRGPK